MASLRYWQHDETGRICEAEKRPSERWDEINFIPAGETDGISGVIESRKEPSGYTGKNSAMALREGLANYAHIAWSGWMHYMFSISEKNADGSVTIPAQFVERWERQLNTPYRDLPEDEKRSDRHEADRMIDIFESDV